MWKYFAKRFCMMIVALFFIILLTFSIMHAVPGGPFTSNKSVSAEVEAALNAKYNLDAPLYEQFFDYLGGVVRGDFGPSYQYRGKSVNDFIKNGFPVSARLGTITIIFVLLTAIPMGILAAVKNGRWQDIAQYGSGHHWRYHSILCHCFGIDIRIFVPAELASYIRGRHLEGLHSSGCGLGRLFHQLHCQTDAFQPSGGYGTGLYSDCQGKGTFRNQSNFAPCNEKCFDTGYYRIRSYYSRIADRKLCSRKDFCNSRTGISL